MFAPSSKFWWPVVSEDANSAVGNCENCMSEFLADAEGSKEPLPDALTFAQGGTLFSLSDIIV